MKQSDFLETFRQEFGRRFDQQLEWTGGQVLSNKAVLSPKAEYRRYGLIKSNEGIELGDLRGLFRGRTLIIEHESDGVSVQNLVKYWAFLRGELSIRPTSPVVLCHFSNWNSYGSFRDLWAWLRDQMIQDPRKVVDFAAEQFDHGGKGSAESIASIARSLEYLSHTIPDPII
jgi:hypothetical protein